MCHFHTLLRVRRPLYRDVSIRLSSVIVSSPKFLLPCHTSRVVQHKSISTDDSLVLVKPIQTVDYFDEPVTFLKHHNTVLLEKINDFTLAICSKGQTCRGGGSDEGTSFKSAHSVAKVWSGLLKVVEPHNAPISAVVAVGFILVQANVGYVSSVDRLLAHAHDAGIPLLQMAQEAVTYKDDKRLTYRERWHLQALDCLLRHERNEALNIYRRMLTRCPGDTLALSLAMDLASILGDRSAALTIAGSVTTYWQERRLGITGSGIALGIVCVGLAAGGRGQESERLTMQVAKYRGKEIAGALIGWANAHIMDAEGRVAEGIALLMGNEGMETYEGSGLLFFHSRLSSYGAKFALDREESGGRTITLRVYDEYFDGIFEYSGYAIKRPWGRPQKPAPSTFTRDTTKKVGSFLSRLFGGGPSNEKSTTKAVTLSETADNSNSKNQTSLVVQKEPSLSRLRMEDVLCWLPPTPLLLSDATLLLLKQTISQKVKHHDERWTSLQNSWLTYLTVNDTNMPTNLAIVASLLCDPDSIAQLEGSDLEFARGLHSMGALMRLAQKGPSPRGLSEEEKVQWKDVVDRLSAGARSLRFWEVDIRVLVERAVCYAALKSADIESLCIARATCSNSITIRPNSPEEWIRYSHILEAMGDTVASDNARSLGISMGFGQGSFARKS